MRKSYSTAKKLIFGESNRLKKIAVIFAIASCVLFGLGAVGFGSIDASHWIDSFAKNNISKTETQISQAIISNSANAKAASPTDAPQSTKPIANTDTIEIPKIGAKLPIVTATTTDVNKLHSLLDSGVVLYPQSAKFGQIGQTILLGHSAPANWPKIKHDTAFSRINELESGDVINVIYEGKSYQYTVIRTRIISQGTDLPGRVIANNSLLLVTCWPPGHNQKRIVVESSLVQSR